MVWSGQAKIGVDSSFGAWLGHFLVWHFRVRKSRGRCLVELSRTGLLRTVMAMCDHCCKFPISFPWQTEDHFCEVLSRVLDTVWKLAARDSRPVPPHLVVVCDNTPAQAKNQFAIKYLLYTVAKQYFVSTTFFNLMVGHTHEDSLHVWASNDQSVLLHMPHAFAANCP